MLNYIKSGKVITATAPRTLASGDGFLFGSLFGVAVSAAASGAAVEMQTEGVVELPKETPLSITAGDPVYWDNTSFKVDKTSANPLIGVAESTAGSSVTTVRVRLNSGFYPALDESVQQSADVTISAAQMLTLNATPRTIVAAPGAGKALIFERALFFYDYGTAAYAGIAAGEDLAVKYTDASGTVLGTLEATGFLDQTSDQLRWLMATNQNVTPVVNAPLVLHMLTGEVTTGDSPVKVRVFYRVVPSTL